jgi:SH3 domain protein
MNSEQQDIAAIRNELKQTKLELEKVSSEYKTLRESSEDILNLMTTYEAQTEENYRLSSELAVLQKENNNFHRSNMVQWFLAGGAVFFFGWLIGKISRRKRGFTRF